jgi:hypothetical protein
VRSEPPPAEPEGGLPGDHRAFTTSLPWILRFVLAAAIGAAVGFAYSAVFEPRMVGLVGGWITIATGACAATLLSIRKVHVWHVSTFVDGTLVGVVAWPIFVFLVAALVWRTAAHGVYALMLGLIGVLITVPCGWIAGFAYHLALSAAERARAKEDDSA